ncbi:MAG TPA: hypothetical protein VJB60_04605 [Candidatus Peribacterales bacterium]|nr:hypothetical protein [Candidatus Peribacterales bacterium]
MILLFSCVFLFAASISVRAQEQSEPIQNPEPTQEQPAPIQNPEPMQEWIPDECGQAFQFCRTVFEEGSPRWEECLEEEMASIDAACAAQWKAQGGVEQSMPMEQWEWGHDEAEEWEGEDNGEERIEEGDGSGKEQWLEDLQGNIGDLDEETQKCILETIHAKEVRCEVSAVEGCAAKTAFKTLVSEAKCGGEIFQHVEFEEPSSGGHDFSEGSFGEDRGVGGGCIPFSHTLQGLQEEMQGRSPEEILKEYENRKHWMAKAATEHGGDPGEFLMHYDAMGVCPDQAGGMGHGPSMGMPGMMDHPGGMQGPGGGNIGEIFGRAVGMLVQLSQDEHLSDEHKVLVRETLSWFSDALNKIGAGEDIGLLANEAREKLEHLMQTVGGMMGGMGNGGMGMPDPAMMRGEIERMLSMVKMMLEKIPKAMEMMEEMGYEIPEWEERYSAIQAGLSEVEVLCRDAMDATEPEEFRDCFEAMREVMEKKMHELEKAVEATVPREVMDKVGREMGFDEMGERGGGEFHQDRGNMPDMFREEMEHCTGNGKSMEDCKRMMMERMNQNSGMREAMPQSSIPPPAFRPAENEGH